jgi:regulator of sirC expression with transglutaminase-like and TPR domain
MSATRVTHSVADLSEGQRAALLKLLTDDDPAIYEVIRNKIIEQGPSVLDWLKPHITSSDPALRRRAQSIVKHFEKQSADTEFLTFCVRHGEDLDVERGAWLLAETCYPQINTDGYAAILDQFSAALRERLVPGLQPREVLQTINVYLFTELGFHGNEEDYYDPANSYLNRVIDRRTGNPINLCLLYLLVCRRLKLPVTGIGLPGHFLCRYQSSYAELYVDVFHQGKFLAKADCVQYLLRASLSIRDEYLAPVTSRRMLLRICANLHQIYLMRDMDTEAMRLQRYVVALGR